MTETAKKTNKAAMTNPGAINRNGQRVVEFLRKDPQNKLNQIYKVACTLCAHRYGAYSSDLWQRRCPECQEGRPGLSL